LAERDEHAPDTSAGGRAVYADYIREQLAGQEARKTSLEQRGLSVVTTSGALVTLLFGLTTLAVERESFTLPAASRALLVVAIVFFVVAAVAAIVTNMPLSYEGVTAGALRGAVRERWGDSEEAATQMTSLTRIKVLESARRRNNVKAIALFAGMVSEIVAVALVGAAVAFVVWK
jgi:nitrate reductase NapE component